ncbi:hypothetical protein AAFA46_05745 [Oscillospiraceae bacterium WX1]
MFAPIACRPDCLYYSAYTETCDYTLLMFRTRGCPTDACTRYLMRTAPRPWSRVHVTVPGICTTSDIRHQSDIPEPPPGPPENDRCITADCGHELYEGEELYIWEDGETLCSDCLEDKFQEMSLSERAELLGCEHETVAFRKRGGTYGEFNATHDR